MENSFYANGFIAESETPDTISLNVYNPNGYFLSALKNKFDRKCGDQCKVIIDTEPSWYLESKRYQCKKRPLYIVIITFTYYHHVTFLKKTLFHRNIIHCDKALCPCKHNALVAE